MQTVPNISEDLVPFIGSLALSMISAAQVPAASSPLLSIRGNPAGVIRCQFVLSGVIRYRFIFSGVIRYRFIFSGKNDELTPDFRQLTPDFRPTPLGSWLVLRVDDMNASLSGREPLNGAAEPGHDLLEIDVFDVAKSVRAKDRCNA